MLGMLLPTLALALVLGVGGALLIRSIVEGTHDRLLDASLLAIGERLAVDEEDEVTVDLPAVAFGMLVSSAQDNIYYSVTYEGALVTGYRDLPVADVAALRIGETVHRDGRMRGAAVRIAAQLRRVYGKSSPVLVQVAETRNARRRLEWRMLAGLAATEAGLLGLVGLLAWRAIGRGLEPLTRLSRDIDRRAAPGAVSLTPLDTAAVPEEALAPVVAVNALLERLEGSMGAMRRFTADASHQMRTPLAVLRMQLDLMRRRDALGSEDRAALQDLEGAARRLERLLVQLIALARADAAAEGRAVARCAVDLAAITAEILAERAPQGLARDVELQFERPPAPVLVLGDALLIGELAANLLDNAIRYNREGGVVVVRVAVGPSGARLEVEDEGPGIPPAERSRVFERFYRVNRKDGPEGSGLGLAIVRTLADHLGSRVELCDTATGAGLLVRVHFRSSRDPHGPARSA